MTAGRAAGTRRRVPLLFAGLLGANVLAWAFSAFAGRPALLGTALLAWMFGLRHALDADHIAAIDNVVRKLLAEGQRPNSAGLWFSLGHSTVVVLAAGAIALAAVAAGGHLPQLARIGAVVGTLVSALFLLAIAVINLVILRDLWAVFGRVRQGAALDQGTLERLLAGRGLLARLFRPLFGLVDAAWHMYPIGFLFGLGFDTATEVGLLAISAGAAMRGMAPWQTMIFPALFTAGMALVDSADSVLMVGAYGWALNDPLRKLWYNLTMTAASVLVALLIGGIETLALLADRLHLTGGVWTTASHLNDNLTGFGMAVVGVFALCWAVSAALYRGRTTVAAPPAR
jgi:high-affinity nickel-transport protein